MKTETMTPPTALRLARQEAGVSPIALARSVRKSASWFWSLDQGLLVPSRRDAETIAELVGKPVQELFAAVRD